MKFFPECVNFELMSCFLKRDEINFRPSFGTQKKENISSTDGRLGGHQSGHDVVATGLCPCRESNLAELSLPTELHVNEYRPIQHYVLIR
jgi:hypothetical protein